MDATVDAVCVVHEVIDGYYHPTAIDKRPVVGPVPCRRAGDRRATSTSTPRTAASDAAVYVYAAEDAAYFGRMLDA